MCDRTFMCSVFTPTLAKMTGFDCLLTFASVQAEDVRASFLFVDDLNGYHQEWLGSTTTIRRVVASFDFATVSGCAQLVIGSTHARGGTHNLLMNVVSD